VNDFHPTRHALSGADIAFLRNEENWRNGPVVDLFMSYGRDVCIDSARRALFTVPNLIGPFVEVNDIPSKTGYRRAREHIAWSAYLVVCDPQARILPFGVCSFFIRCSRNDLSLCVSPNHVERVCGRYPWFYEPGWVTPPVVDFFRVLVQLARDVFKGCQFELATITDEANEWYRQDVRGIAIPSDVADAAGWNSLKRVDQMALLPAALSR